MSSCAIESWEKNPNRTIATNFLVSVIFIIFSYRVKLLAVPECQVSHQDFEHYYPTPVDVGCHSRQTSLRLFNLSNPL
jgi:hypothetical protein